MTMDSNSLGNLIDVMMMSSSNSSSSSRSACENDAKKRRFSEAQVKSLEVMFEAQTKLEPRKKQQLAKELGLQPRQVAIWFQNKRARWKSKQLERAYAALSADYDSLRSSFDSLLHQKNVLSMQVERLAEMLETNPQEKKERGKQSTDCRVEGGDGEADQTPMLNLSSNANNSDAEKKLLSPFLGGKEAEHHLQRTKEQGGSRSLVSDESEQQQQFCFNNTAGWPSDQLVTGGVCSQWWEFLSYE